jgi:hypothetical protein
MDKLGNGEDNYMNGYVYIHIWVWLLFLDLYLVLNSGLVLISGLVMFVFGFCIWFFVLVFGSF